MWNNCSTIHLQICFSPLQVCLQPLQGSYRVSSVGSHCLHSFDGLPCSTFIGCHERSWIAGRLVPSHVSGSLRDLTIRKPCRTTEIGGRAMRLKPTVGLGPASKLSWGVYGVAHTGIGWVLSRRITWQSAGANQFPPTPLVHCCAAAAYRQRGRRQASNL